MKIAFLTYGATPVPATKGGAVENLIEDLLDQNEHYHSFDAVVYSIFETEAAKKAQKYKNTRFQFIKCPGLIDLCDRMIYFLAKNILKKENLISYRYILTRLYVMRHYPRCLIKEDFDKVILITNSTLFFVLKNKKVAQKYKNKVIYYLHNEVRSLFKCEEQAASVNKLIGISEFVNTSFRKQVPSLRDDQCFVLKNCIDTKMFSERNENKIEQYKEKFHIMENDFVVVFAGRIIKEKGALETIEAIKLCKRENIKLMIVGSGFYSSDVSDPYAEKLKEISEEIKDRIIFTGYINYEDMPCMYRLANVAVLPSMWEEPAGMTMVEAAISGIPLITTASGGIPEYIPEKAAIILKRDEHLSENIAESIIMLMDHPKVRDQYSKEGKKLSGKYNLDNFYHNFSEIINSD